LAVNRLDGEGRVLDGASRLWPQTEWARASLFAGDTADQARAFGAVDRYLDPHFSGLWIDLIDSGAPIAGPAPGSSLYHIANIVFAQDPAL
jgi:mannose-6-phosphate isomerase